MVCTCKRIFLAKKKKKGRKKERKKEKLIPATTWMHFENNVLSEINPS